MLGLQGHLDLLDLRGRKEGLEILDHEDQLVSQDHLGLQDRREILEMLVL